jgi:branched-chain amino acid transport system ATP-binding protein
VLEIVNLHTGYGAKPVILGVTLSPEEGRITALIGPNGSGKSTLLKAAFGLIPAWQGTVRFDGNPVSGFTPSVLISRGLVLSLQGNRVFDELTVLDNLELGALPIPHPERMRRVEEILRTSPALGDCLAREARTLSGGERQMLALARSLLPKPRLLMLDEPSLGLDPKQVKTVLAKIVQINQELGISILIVEQKVRSVLEICHRVHSLKLGRLNFSGPPGDLLKDADLLRSQFV